MSFGKELIDLLKDKNKKISIWGYVMVVGRLREEELVVVNLYDKHNKEIANMMPEISWGITIVGGDFNSVQDDKPDRTPAETGPCTKKIKCLKIRWHNLAWETHGDRKTPAFFVSSLFYFIFFH